MRVSCSYINATEQTHCGLVRVRENDYCSSQWGGQHGRVRISHSQSNAENEVERDVAGNCACSTADEFIAMVHLPARFTCQHGRSALIRPVAGDSFVVCLQLRRTIGLGISAHTSPMVDPMAHEPPLGCVRRSFASIVRLQLCNMARCRLVEVK